MALIITGLGTSYGSCSSLRLLERSLYNGGICHENEAHDPINVAVNAFQDAALVGDFQLGLLSSNPVQLIISRHNGFEQSTQIGTIPPNSGAIFQAVQQADDWIQENHNRVVLITISSDIGTGSMLLAHPSRNTPAYARIELTPAAPISQTAGERLFPSS